MPTLEINSKTFHHIKEDTKTLMPRIREFQIKLTLPPSKKTRMRIMKMVEILQKLFNN